MVCMTATSMKRGEQTSVRCSWRSIDRARTPYAHPTLVPSSENRHAVPIVAGQLPALITMYFTSSADIALSHAMSAGIALAGCTPVSPTSERDTCSVSPSCSYFAVYVPNALDSVSDLGSCAFHPRGSVTSKSSSSSCGPHTFSMSIGFTRGPRCSSDATTLGTAKSRIGSVRIFVAPASLTILPLESRTEMRGFALMSRPSNTCRLSPLAPWMIALAIASVARARCVESICVDRDIELRRPYCCSPVAVRIHLPANSPSGDSDPSMSTRDRLRAAESIGNVISSLVPSGCTTSPNSPGSPGGSAPYGARSAVRSTYVYRPSARLTAAIMWSNWCALGNDGSTPPSALSSTGYAVTPNRRIAAMKNVALSLQSPYLFSNIDSGWCGWYPPMPNDKDT